MRHSSDGVFQGLRVLRFHISLMFHNLDKQHNLLCQGQQAESNINGILKQKQCCAAYLLCRLHFSGNYGIFATLQIG